MKHLSPFSILVFLTLMGLLTACPTPPADQKCLDPSKVDKDKICNMMYAPVCGCNDKTYSNACIAEANGVLKWKDGKCVDTSSDCIDPSSINPYRGCEKIYRPVCGCDGKTYDNACMAKKAGLTQWTDGKCDEKTP